MVRKGREILLYMETDGSSTTGVFTAYSPDFVGGVSEIVVAKGMKYKIWLRSVTGSVTVKVEYTSTGDWTAPVVIGSFSENITQAKYPITVVGRTGKEKIRFTWEQATASKAGVTLAIEFELEE